MNRISFPDLLRLAFYAAISANVSSLSHAEPPTDHVIAVGFSAGNPDFSVADDFARDGTLNTAYILEAPEEDESAFSIAALGGDLLAGTANNIYRYSIDGTPQGVFAPLLTRC